MTDERESLPSISSFEALALCPIRHRLGLMAPEPPPSKDAQYGLDVAKARETGETEDLTQEQRDLVREMVNQENLLMREIFGKQMSAEFYREKRFWYRQAVTCRVPGEEHQKLFSGKLDFSAWAHGPERVSVYFDDKALWGDTTPPAHNKQLRGGAVLMKQNFGSRRVFVAILQPTRRKFEIAAEYGPEELEQAERESVLIVERAMSPDAKANPGPEQCKHCRAKLICKVAYRESVDHLAASHDLVEGVPNLSTELIKQLGDDDLDLMGSRWEVAQIIGKAIDTEVRRRKEENPEAMPNYHFVPSGHTSEIANPALVWPKFKHLLTPEQFSAICSVGKGKLEKAVNESPGFLKQPLKAKDLVEDLLGDLLVKKPKTPSLKRRPYYEIK